MFESHFQYFLKNLKNDNPEVRTHRKGAPLIIANGV